ncbi:Protein disulfide-isomerase 5-4 [Diplonema papillatum]|nr:Protein disulfide-isomerase 5-4 [Diplonema papillatum]|eukprot:gene12400-19176_t
MRSIDAFRCIPKDLCESSVGGGVLTLVAAVVGVVLLGFEVQTYMTVSSRSELVMTADDSEMLSLSFSLTFHDLDCDYLRVGVKDSFGTDRLNIEKSVTKTSIDHEGNKGRPYSDEELFVLDPEHLSEDEQAVADADWVSSSDMVAHGSIESVVNAHGFTFVLFYARATKSLPRVKCEPCKAIRPAWDDFEEKANARPLSTEIFGASSPVARKLTVRALRINCVDFQGECANQKISTLPTIRLYRRGHEWDREFYEYNLADGVTVEGLASFLRKKMSLVNLRADRHNFFTKSCLVSGTLDVARVPGTLHFEAAHPPGVNLNFAVTNVSHTVHHFAFGLTPTELESLPTEYISYAAPLNGLTFIAEEFHTAPHHFINVVSTRYQSLKNPTGVKLYQLTRQSRIARMSYYDTPSARFSYDLAPLEVNVVEERGNTWYGFITTAFAVLGGTITVASMIASFLR